MTKLLTKLRLLDEDGALSLTHLAVYLAFYCMVRGVQVSWSEMGAFLIAMASYRVKRAFEPEPDKDHSQRITDLEQDVKKLDSLTRASVLQAREGGRSGR